MTHTYTDEDVQKLVNTVKELIAYGRFRNDWYSTSETMKDMIKPFEPDPWEELTKFRYRQNYVMEVDATKELIDKAVDLGLVTKVEGTR